MIFGMPVSGRDPGAPAHPDGGIHDPAENHGASSGRDISDPVDNPQVGSQRWHEERTRDRVLRCVSETGPVTATALARRLGLTATGIRRHLDALVERGDIAPADVSATPRGRGRPARAYVVAPTGHRRMATQYDDVATAALHYLSEQVGADAVAAFARQRIAALELRYAERVGSAGREPAAKAEALAQVLAEDGFAATARPIGTPAIGIQLCQGHCPMHEVATQFPAFCEAETEAFARLLGVHVQRLATLANGEHVCTTFIPAHQPTEAEPGTSPAPSQSPVSPPVAHQPAADETKVSRDPERTGA